MAFHLPLRTDVPHYEFQTTLDAVTYTIEMQWNGRESSWYLSLFTEDGDPISMSNKVVLNYPLMGRCVDLRKPPGVFMALDTSGETNPPGLNELGARVIILYHDAADLPIEV